MLVEVDIEKSKAFDLKKTSGAYRALLWACARGMVSGVIGAPPCRRPEDEHLVAKQFWLAMVAKAARAMYHEDPVYIMIEGKAMLNNLKGDFDGNLSGMKATWQSVLEDMC